MGEALLSGWQQATTLESLFMLIIGVMIGFVVGVLPGLGGAVTIALLIPVTFGMDPVPAFSLLLGMYVVSSIAGDFTSILFGIPGEPTAAAMVLDGYPMNKKGQAGRALGASLSSSAIGAIFGALVLMALIPVIRPLMLGISAPELFAAGLLGLTFIATLSSGSIHKGLIMVILGVMIALVGIDPNLGVPRYTFGSLYLWEGVGIVPVVVGLLGGAEVFQTMLEKKDPLKDQVPPHVGGLFAGISDGFRHWWLTLRASAIGAAFGVLPGLGGAVAQFVAYGHAKQTSKHPEEFGKGSIEGVIAAGATTAAKDGGALVPTVAFGVPGGAGMAVLLGAFLIQGLNPGPEMLTENLDITLSLVWIIVLSTLVAVLLGYALVRPLAKLTTVSGRVLVPFLVVMLTIGAYTNTNSLADVWVMVAFLVIGIVAAKYKWPRIPLLLGVVLGGILERYFTLSYSLFEWGWLSRPGVIAVEAVIAAMIVLTVVRLVLKRHATKRERVLTGDIA
ncbi:tripartite tricarboxylate transporter permease [Arthrobacter sp. TMS1-12-1]